MTDELQRVLNAVAWLISCMSKYDHSLSVLLHNSLHWLDIPQQEQYKLAIIVHQCLHIKHTAYCIPVSEVAGRQHLWSASHGDHQLAVPHVCCSTFGCCCFASAGPTVWNSLSGPDQFRQNLKTHLFACCYRFTDCVLLAFLHIHTRSFRLLTYCMDLAKLLPQKNRLVKWKTENYSSNSKTKKACLSALMEITVAKARLDAMLLDATLYSVTFSLFFSF